MEPNIKFFRINKRNTTVELIQDLEFYMVLSPAYRKIYCIFLSMRGYIIAQFKLNMSRKMSLENIGNYQRIIPDASMAYLDLKLNELYFREDLQTIDTVNLQPEIGQEKLEYFAAITRNIIQINCGMKESAVNSLTLRLGMSFGYLIRVLPQDKIHVLSKAVAEAANNYFIAPPGTLGMFTINTFKLYPSTTLKSV